MRTCSRVLPSMSLSRAIMRLNVASKEVPPPLAASVHYRERTGGGVYYQVAGRCCRCDEFTLKSYGLIVRMCFLNLFSPNIRDVSDCPHTFGPARLFLNYHAEFSLMTRSVTKTHSSLVPCQHVNNAEGRTVDPVAEIRAKVKLVHPEKEVAGGNQDTPDFFSKLDDNFFRHLWQLHSDMVSTRVLVAVLHLVVNPTKLRIEKCGWYRVVVKHAKKF